MSCPFHITSDDSFVLCDRLDLDLRVQIEFGQTRIARSQALGNPRGCDVQKHQLRCPMATNNGILGEVRFSQVHSPLARSERKAGCIGHVSQTYHIVYTNITTTNADSDDKLVRRMSGQIEENLADLTVNTS